MSARRWGSECYGHGLGCVACCQSPSSPVALCVILGKWWLLHSKNTIWIQITSTLALLSGNLLDSRCQSQISWESAQLSPRPSGNILKCWKHDTVNLPLVLPPATVHSREIHRCDLGSNLDLRNIKILNTTAHSFTNKSCSVSFNCSSMGMWWRRSDAC